MFEPVTLLTGFLTLWAQLNNYGIDTEKYPHLKNVRVRRDIENQLYGVNNRVHNTNNLRDSVIMKNIIKNIENDRTKRHTNYYNANNNNNANNNTNNNINYDYVEVKIPIANYPPYSQYYSQNSDGVPYYYNAYNGNTNSYYRNNNNAYNGNNNGLNNNNAYNGNNNGLNNGYVSPYQSNGRNTLNGQYNYRNTQEKSGRIIMPGNNFNVASGGQAVIPQNTYGNNDITAYTYNNNGYNANNGYNYTYNRNNNNGYNANNGNNNTDNGNNYNNNVYNANNNTYNRNNYKNGYNATAIPLLQNNNNKDIEKNIIGKTVKPAYFMSSLGCPQFMRSVTIFGTKVCVEDDY